MGAGRFVLLVGLTASLAACAAKAQVRTDVELPLLDPPPAPPRVVASYPIESEAMPVAPAVEAVAPSRPPVRTQRFPAVRVCSTCLRNHESPLP